MWQRGKHRGGISTRTACVCMAQLGSGGRRRMRERTANILLMSVTLEVSKLSGWLKAFAFCRVQRGHPTQGNACGTEVDVWHRGKGESAALVWRACVWPSSECVGAEKAQAEAHREHPAHVCDAGGVPTRHNVGIEGCHVKKEPFHVDDGRDVPVGDGAVRVSSRCRVLIVRSDCYLQGEPGRQGAAQEHRQPLWRAGNAAGGRSCFRAALAHDLRGVDIEIVQPEDSGESRDAD